MDQYFQGSVTQSESIDCKHLLEKWNSVSEKIDELEGISTSGFDCNICLDTVQDPVVTLCGHLYCWPCIYKWIHCQSSSLVDHERQAPQCPVCKDEVSEKTIVPLYGPGKTSLPSETKAPNLGIIIPQRPPSPRCGVNTLVSPTARPYQQSQHPGYQQQQTHPNYPYMGTYAPRDGLTATGASLFDHPMIGMFGEMVHGRMFGNSELTSVSSNANSYQLAGSTSPRVRRHVMEADKSLGRISFFLLCCMILCLLLF